MDAQRISTGQETTDDDRALNAVHEAIVAGKVVTYRGSVEALWGRQVLWLERCEFHHPTDPWADCCHRQQAIVGIREGTTQEAELRHVSALSLRVEGPEESAARHSPVDWFRRGVYPACACGYAPRDNEALTVHWAEVGIAWYDDHGQLKWTVASA